MTPLRTQRNAYTINPMKTINVREARERFADVLEEANTEPILVTRHGRPLAVIMNPDKAAAAIALETAEQRKRKKA